MDNSKPFWASKTIWVNLVAVVAAISGAFSLDLGLTPEAQASVVGAIMGVVNLVLRFTTKGPVKASSK